MALLWPVYGLEPPRAWLCPGLCIEGASFESERF